MRWMQAKQILSASSNKMLNAPASGSRNFHDRPVVGFHIKRPVFSVARELARARAGMRHEANKETPGEAQGLHHLQLGETWRSRAMRSRFSALKSRQEQYEAEVPRCVGSTHCGWWTSRATGLNAGEEGWGDKEESLAHRLPGRRSLAIRARRKSSERTRCISAVDMGSTRQARR